MWLLVVCGALLLRFSLQADSTMCDLEACSCMVHGTDDRYVKGANVSVDIFCSCGHLRLPIMYLLSPPPVPYDTQLLHITHCKEVIVEPIDVDSKNSWTFPVSLAIIDVPKVEVKPGGGLWAQFILIRNVSEIPEIPAEFLKVASFPSHPIAQFHMENVGVGVVRENALAGVHVAKEFQMSNVHVVSLEELAISVVITQPKGEFKLSNCSIGTVASSGLSVTAQYVTLEHSNFSFIDSHGIKVIAENFAFASCAVMGMVSSYALDVQARVVLIVHNHFAHLETGAFFAVRKAEMFAKLGMDGNWLFLFSNNRIKHANPDSLSANWTLGSNDLVRENVFEDCSCDNINWIWFATREDNFPVVKSSFYSELLNPEFNNVCELQHCDPVPLHMVTELLINPVDDISSKLCDTNVTALTDLCKFYQYQHASSAIPRSLQSVISLVILAMLCKLSIT